MNLAGVAWYSIPARPGERHEPGPVSLVSLASPSRPAAPAIARISPTRQPRRRPRRRLRRARGCGSYLPRWTTLAAAPAAQARARRASRSSTATSSRNVPPSTLLCRDLLVRGSNQMRRMCGTAEQWKTYERREAQAAGGDGSPDAARPPGSGQSGRAAAALAGALATDLDAHTGASAHAFDLDTAP